MSEGSGKFGIFRPAADKVRIEFYKVDGELSAIVNFDEDAIREFTRDLVAVVLNKRETS